MKEREASGLGSRGPWSPADERVEEGVGRKRRARAGTMGTGESFPPQSGGLCPVQGAAN